MVKKDIDIEKLMKYWVESSDDDFETMMTMYESGRFNWSLFIGHLVIEKLLKAYYLKSKHNFPPYIHNLIRMAELSELELTEEQKVFLVTVTAFNINTRYDDYKLSFRNKCTSEFTLKWINEIKSFRIWIKKFIIQ